MSTYTITPAAPNLVATLWGPLSEIIDPLLDGSGAPVTDPGMPELLGALGEALTAAVRVTRGTRAAAPAPATARATAVRIPAARVTTAQVGSVAGEPKPGSLRARLIDHLAANPGQAFTVTELFHAVDATSGGAVGAALNTMIAHGEAVLASEAPKRYTAPAGTTAPAPAPAEPSADTGDDTDQDTAPAADDTDDPDETSAAAPEPEASTDADTADEPGPDQDPTPDTTDDEQATPAPAPQARATRRTKTRR